MCIESGKKLIDKNLEYQFIECRQQDENFASYYSKNDFINLGENTLQETSEVFFLNFQ